MKIRNILVGFLCSIFMLYVFAFSPVLLWMKSELKTEMKHKINNHLIDSETTLLHFTENEFNSISWVDEDEFMFDGVLYDLLCIDKKENGEYILKAVSDNEEKQVMQLLVDNSNTNNTAGHHYAHLLFHLLAQYDSSVESINFNQFQTTTETCFVYVNLYSFSDFQNFSPPPQRA